MSQANDKSVGIIGAGRIGRAIARIGPRAGRRVIFLSGEEDEAKSEVGALFESVGFFVVDLGGLADGGRMQQVGSPLAGKNLIHLP